MSRVRLSIKIEDRTVFSMVGESTYHQKHNTHFCGASIFLNFSDFKHSSIIKLYLGTKSVNSPEIREADSNLC